MLKVVGGICFVHGEFEGGQCPHPWEECADVSKQNPEYVEAARLQMSQPKLYTQTDLDRARTEGAAEMVEQAAQLLRDDFSKDGRDNLPPEERRLVNGILEYNVERILALTLIPNFKERIRREALEEAKQACHGVGDHRNAIPLTNDWSGEMQRAAVEATEDCEDAVEAMKEQPHA